VTNEHSPTLRKPRRVGQPRYTWPGKDGPVSDGPALTFSLVSQRRPDPSASLRAGYGALRHSPWACPTTFLGPPG